MSDPYYDPDVRPFFGEQASVAGETLRAPVGGSDERRGTVEELWEMRIADGLCPRGSCSGELDPDGYCSVCGWSLTEHRMRRRLATVEDRDSYVPRIPGALKIDEYAPAIVDPEAA